MHNKFQNKRNFMVALMVLPMLSFSQGQILEGSTNFSNALFNTLLGVIIFLMIVIVAMSQVLKNLSQSDYITKKIKEKNESKNNGAKIKGVALLSLFVLDAQAQNNSNASWLVGGLEMSTFFFMISIIVLELVFIGVLFNTLKNVLLNDVQASAEPVVKKKEKSIMDQLNASVDIENESEIMMDHDYDGIRELDNDLPPWWRYGFYLTILIAFVYLIHFHISGTGDLQRAEYSKDVAKAKAEIEAFMKESANNVDETTIKMMEGADLAAGKELFIASCAACHGKLGEGGVGPNLTDEYWVHGGSLVDIFKTVKYGWPDKGMKAWKEDLSPIQMAQISSFIRTLKGTNPPNAKAQQGDLYIEQGSAPSDSTNTGNDSLQVKALADTLVKAAAVTK